MYAYFSVVQNIMDIDSYILYAFYCICMHFIAFVCIFTLGASVEVHCDSENHFKGLFFQDVQMREAFHASLKYCLLMLHISFWNLVYPYTYFCVKIPMA